MLLCAMDARADVSGDGWATSEKEEASICPTGWVGGRRHGGGRPTFMRHYADGCFPAVDNFPLLLRATQVPVVCQRNQPLIRSYATDSEGHALATGLDTAMQVRRKSDADNDNTADQHGSLCAHTMTYGG